MSRGLLSKLSMQASQYYDAALATAEKLAERGATDFWVLHCRQQQLQLLAAAHFQKAMAQKDASAKELKGFGECIARFQLAMATAEAAEAACQRLKIDTRNLASLKET